MSLCFDYREALERVGGDRDLLREVAGIFATDAPEMMDSIAEAITGGDPDAIFRSAHKLKGSVANFSAHDAIAAASTLERIGAAGQTEGAAEAFSALKLEVERVGRALAEFAADGWVEEIEDGGTSA